MDDFDDEPTTGGGYERVFAIALYDPDGIPRRIIVRRRGRFERVSILLEEVRDGLTGHLMRYDDAHEHFHRHEPGWPEPAATIAEWIEDVPAHLRAAYAIAEVRTRYTTWEAEVFGREGTTSP